MFPDIFFAKLFVLAGVTKETSRQRISVFKLRAMYRHILRRIFFTFSFFNYTDDVLPPDLLLPPAGLRFPEEGEDEGGEQRGKCKSKERRRGGRFIGKCCSGAVHSIRDSANVEGG